MAHTKFAAGSSPDSKAASNDGVGIFYMMLSEVLLAAVNSIVKSVPWSSQKIMVVRYSVDFVLCLIACKFMGLRPPSYTVAARLMLRGASYCMFILFLWAGIRSCLPLGDVVVLVIASSPIFLVASARLLLGESIPNGWYLQFVICVFGAMLINKPLAIDTDCPASTGLLPLGAGFCGAMMNLASRSLKEIPPPLVCMFNDIVAVTFGFTWLMLESEATSQANQTWIVGLVVLSAFIGCAGLMSNVKGYQSVSFAGIASIAGNISVPLGYACQVFLFGQTPDLLSGIGAALIVGVSIFKAVQGLIQARAASYEITDPESKQGATTQYTKLPAGDETP